MTLSNSDTRGGFETLKIVVVVGFLISVGILGWIGLTELFSFGALPGQAPTGQIQDIPIVGGVDRWMLHAPLVGPLANSILEAQGQHAWQSFIFWAGLLMIFTCGLILLIKRVLEPVNDETTVMHLKGDTDTALRAKGGRG